MSKAEEPLSIVCRELSESRAVLGKFLADEDNLQNIVQAAELLVKSFKSEGKAIACGNGGSHCDAMHFAEELTGRYRDNRPAYPAIAISDPSHLSCVGNDYGYEYVFSRFIEGLGRSVDVLFGITTSGNSANIIHAVDTARTKGMGVILLTGNDGGKLAGTADVEVRIPHYGYADRIQEMHIKIIHIIIQLIEKGMARV